MRRPVDRRRLIPLAVTQGVVPELLRPVRPDDIPALVDHRHRMFLDIGGRTEDQIAGHDARYRRWVRARLARREVFGYLAEGSDGRALASALLWFRPDHPRPGTTKDSTPYVFSVYTVPSARRKGLATRLVRRLVEEARRRGYPRIVLHASEMGLPVYEKLGFERTREMRIVFDRLRTSRARVSRSRSRRRSASIRAGRRARTNRGGRA